MLRIRREQMAVLGQYSRVEFARRLFLALKEALPSYEITNEIVEAGMREAFGFGIHRERDVVQFVELGLRYRRAWGRTAWPVRIERMLASEGVPASERLQRLDAWVKELKA